MTGPEIGAPEIDAIVQGYCSDAFAVLGPHESDNGAWVVRAFLPHAEEAFVLCDGAEHPMAKLDPAGFCEAHIPTAPGAYRIRQRFAGGVETTSEDAYRFGPLLTSFDLHLHGEGTNYESYRTMGAHLAEMDGVRGVRFAVWAPNAQVVSLTGDFNHWDTRCHPMRRRDGGIWEIFLPELGEGTKYKYAVRSRYFAHSILKADPYGFAFEVPPRTASIVTTLGKYEWADSAWMEARGRKNRLNEPMSTYEVHLGSWMRTPGNEALSYRELADTLVSYVARMGYTHLELMPIAEHPYSGSWGYQVTGYYAPTSRFGSPENFKYFIDRCHQAGIGVILDWVPAHFPKDAHGLANFDGTALYEHEDPRKGEHRDWGTLIFNYDRMEVRTFLISNAMFWLKEYHIDGLRVDAVASMIYLDYSRQPGDWIPNIYGGRENIEALSLLRRTNELAHEIPGVVTIAEESTSFPGISRPVYLGGLGFTMKWNMGWMHDMLDYFSNDPLYRKFHHNNITFSLIYAFSENFVLPVSHDEVVHLKKSLLSKMPGDAWQKFANVRAFLSYMYGHPGKKLMFMGSEIGEWDEWNENRGVNWDLLQYDLHRKLQNFVRELNLLYKSHPALWEVDYHWSGFEWIDFRDIDNSAISFLRRPADKAKPYLLFCCNFTPVPHHGYRIGVPDPGTWHEILNSDAEAFGGSGVVNGAASTEPFAFQGHYHSLRIALPPLGVAVFESPTPPFRS
jgi:1,4-alpha-glucan branching enzyme